MTAEEFEKCTNCKLTNIKSGDCLIFEVNQEQVDIYGWDLIFKYFDKIIEILPEHVGLMIVPGLNFLKNGSNKELVKTLIDLNILYYERIYDEKYIFNEKE